MKNEIKAIEYREKNINSQIEALILLNILLKWDCKKIKLSMVNVIYQ